MLSVAAALLACGAGLAYWLTRPTPESLLAQARLCFASGDFDGAVELASRALELKADWVPALLVAAKAAGERGDFEDELKFCRMLPERASGSDVVEALKVAGQQALYLGRASDAEQLYQRALKHAPDDLVIHRRLSALYLSESRRWESAPHLFALLRGKAFTIEELVFLGNLEEVYDAEQFMTMFESAVEDDLVPLMGRARVLLFKNFSQEGEELLRRIIEQHPGLVEAHAQLGVIFVSMSRLPELELWERQLPKNADQHPEIWWVRGTRARMQDDTRGAIRCAWEAMRLDPNHVGAAYQLAQLLAVDGRPDDARLFAERAAMLESFCSTIHDILLVGHTPERMIKAAQLAESLGRPWEAWGWHVAVETYHPKSVLPGERQRLRAMLTDDLPRVLPSHDLSQLVDLSEYPRPTWTPQPERAPQEGDASLPPVRFADLSPSAGLDFVYENGAPREGPGFMIYQSIASGAGVIDYDRDSSPDLYFPQSGPWPPQPPLTNDRLYRQRDGRCVDVSRAAIPEDADLGFGVAVGDWNADGLADIYVGNLGRNRLLENNGDGTFRDATADAGLTAAEWTASCAIADVNGDGLPELYDVNYCAGERPLTHKCFRGKTGTIRTCIPTEFVAADDMLWLNQGDGRFEEIGERAGTRALDGRGLGLIVGNLDAEPGTDIYVANDMTANFLFSNRTARPGDPPRFGEQGVIAGLAYDSDGRPMASMGIAADDADGDGLIDLYVTNFYNESDNFYHQQSGGFYVDAARPFNLRDGGIVTLSWGTQFIDAELDGRPDLLVANGHVDDFADESIPFHMKPQFFSNRGKTFVELFGDVVGPYFDDPQLARGMARLDWDRDGREDVVIVRLFEPAVLLANRTPGVGHHLGVRLVGQTQRDAIGSEVLVTTGGRTLYKQLTAGDGFASSNERRLVFGLGDAVTIDQLVVRWHGGDEQVFTNLDVDQDLVLVEGRQSPLPLPREVP